MLPSAHGNRTTSKWRRRLLTRAKRKQANFSMWEEVKKKWRDHQEASKTKADRQEVEQISETVNRMQSQENNFDKLMEETNNLNCSIDAIIS